MMYSCILNFGDGQMSSMVDIIIYSPPPRHSMGTNLYFSLYVIMYS